MSVIPTYIRSYPLQHHCNTGKIAAIKETIGEYRSACKTLALGMWRTFFQETGVFANRLDCKTVTTGLSSRYTQTACVQVAGVLNSFLSNRKNDFSRIVEKSNLSDTDRHVLHTINRNNDWYKKDVSYTKVTADASHFALSRKIMKHILSQHNRPSFKRINMALDAKVAEIREVDKMDTFNGTPGAAFDYWVRLSTAEKGNPVLVPLTTNDYFENAGGNLLNSLQVNMDYRGNISFVVAKEHVQQEYHPTVREISLDIGLKKLFCVNDGAMFGQKFFDQLKEYDARIQPLAANRRRQNLMENSERLDAQWQDLREYIKNETNRCINQIVRRYNPQRIIVETLEFRYGGLSRRMNRFLSNMGLSTIYDKLASLTEELGIEIVEVNPAYTSQECHKCGFVSKSNRRTQGEFACLFCGCKCNADVNGSRTVQKRGSLCSTKNCYNGTKKESVQKLRILDFLKPYVSATSPPALPKSSSGARYRSIANWELSNSFPERSLYQKLLSELVPVHISP
jgi:putative transposase